MMIKIPESFLEKIVKQAESESPRECCGLILGPREEPGQLTRLRPCQNVQDQHHQRDPEGFSRTSQKAYVIAPKELKKVLDEVMLYGEEIRVIYHSHIEADAEFSREDERLAVWEGAPVYPGVSYLIVSVRQGVCRGHKIFGWDQGQGKFVAAQ